MKIKGASCENGFTGFKEITSYTENIKEEMGASGAALVILQDDRIMHEWYAGTHHFEQGAREIDAASRFNVYSVRVTYIGLALAIAVKEGYLKLDDKLRDYLNEYDPEILGETTIRHLVTRSTGLKFRENNVFRVFDLGTNLEGKRPDLLAKVLYKATGFTVNEWISEKVCKQLKLENTGWVTEGERHLVCDVTSPKSYPTLRIGSNIGDERNLYVNARELATWGNLHLNKGRFEGRQVLPREVFDLATSVQSPNSVPSTFPKFGFFWWIKDDDVTYEYNELGSNLPYGSYQILGASGCSCLVIPKFNAVAVRMYNSLNESKDFDYVKDIQSFGNIVASSLARFSRRNEK
ncbi:CubicO group peptidase, beta-lactamase class C family [Oceanobacillus limi]|uniref:CubicO group peptidase, beta-lactamase class C family n=1 Tax=Oceanobacillus limi TaxID=930131 RepID=A0A1I0G023_9BACI|nr:serine hydrolase [Oceanobacillus limi]SET63897.1 CubicO group peptidase, beta-lactamase class C family [Oceanobacillus limi]